MCKTTGETEGNQWNYGKLDVTEARGTTEGVDGDRKGRSLNVDSLT